MTTKTTKKYYKPKRKPLDQIWPNRQIVRKTIRMETSILEAVEAYAPNLEKEFKLDRKASKSLTVGYLICVGMDNAQGGYVAPITMGNDQHATTLCVDIPAATWKELERIRFVESLPDEPLTIRQLTHRYLALGLYAVSSKPLQNNEPAHA